MKDNPTRLKKWLFSYLISSFSLFLFRYLWSHLGKSPLGLDVFRPLFMVTAFFVVTFFFYLKITQKSIWWILTTIFLACFLSLLLSLITTLFKFSNSVLGNYLFFSFLCTIFNLLFMLAGVYIEKKTRPKYSSDDILDD